MYRLPSQRSAPAPFWKLLPEPRSAAVVRLGLAGTASQAHRKRICRWTTLCGAASAMPPSWSRCIRAPTAPSAVGHTTCNIQCHGCSRTADVRLIALPQDCSWSRVGRRLVCKECGAAGSVNIVPNWYDRIGHAVPFSPSWKPG
jgi:hypothetical protein